MSFKRTLIAATIAVSSLSAMAQSGGLTIGNTGNSVTVSVGGTSTTTSLSSFTTTVAPVASTTYAKYAPISFDASNWTVSGGGFTSYEAASAGGTYTSATNVGQFITAAQTSISTGVQSEVTYISGLVTTASASITAYNSSNATDLTAPGSGLGATAKADIDAVVSEVNTTRSAINTIKGMKFNTAASLTATSKVIGGTTYQDYTGANVITTGASNTLSSTGAVTFGN